MNYGEQDACRHDVPACPDGLRCAHEVLFCWTTSDFHRTQHVFQPCCDEALVLAQWLDRFVTWKQRETRFEARPPLLGLKEFEATARNRSHEVDDAIWFLCYSLLKIVNGFVLSKLLYRMHDERLELNKPFFRRRPSPLEFAAVSKSLTKTLDIAQLQLPPLDMTEIDEDGNIVIRPGWRPALTPLHRNWLLLFSAAGWSFPKLHTKRPISVYQYIIDLKITMSAFFLAVIWRNYTFNMQNTMSKNLNS